MACAAIWLNSITQFWEDPNLTVAGQAEYGDCPDRLGHPRRRGHRVSGSASGMVRPCSCPDSNRSWQGAPNTGSQRDRRWMDAATRPLRPAAKDALSGTGPRRCRKDTRFDGAGAAPKIQREAVAWPPMEPPAAAAINRAWLNLEPLPETYLQRQPPGGCYDPLA